MNRQVTQILQLGIFFSAIAVFLDVFLTQLPILDWLVLGVAFFFIATLILDSVARLVPNQKHGLPSKREEYDELERLEAVVDRAVNEHNPESLRTLCGKLKSIALATVAARTNLPKRELQELADNDPRSLLGIIKEGRMVRLLTGDESLLANGNRLKVEELLATIEAWSP